MLDIDSMSKRPDVPELAAEVTWVTVGKMPPGNTNAKLKL
jgi:hypothetical protein